MYLGISHFANTHSCHTHSGVCSSGGLWGLAQCPQLALALPQSSTEISVDNIVPRTEGSQTFKSQDCFTFLKLVENPKEPCFCGSHLLVFIEFDVN